MDDLIRLVQLPVIEEHLKALKASIEEETSKAMSLACTPDTIQAVKKQRTELNKQFGELEDRRKAVKAKYMEAYNAFDVVYKDCVTDPCKAAINNLTGKINDVESTIKADCEAEMRGYVKELCEAQGIDFVRYEDVGLKIDMTNAKQVKHKKLKEQAKAFIDKVSEDAEAISGMEDAAEIMAGYKVTLDLPGTIREVQRRHKAIEEQEKRLADLEARRAAQREAIKRVEAVAPPVVVQQPTVVPAPAAEKPVEVQKTLSCTFTVHATRDQLRALKEFLNKEGIQYE